MYVVKSFLSVFSYISKGHYRYKLYVKLGWNLL